MKTAILIYSDPGSEEALGRCFTGLTAAHEGLQNGDNVTVIFGGTGTRWPVILAQPDHPAHKLYEEIKHTIQGACNSCANIFGAAEDAQNVGIDLIGGVSVPGSVGSGLPSLRQLIRDGYTVLSF